MIVMINECLKQSIFDDEITENCGKNEGVKEGLFIKSKKANIAVDPLLTNPLNSCTKLQISAT